MIWVKRISLAVLALLLFLVIALAALLYTPAGVKIAIWGAEKALPALSIEQSDGSLLQGFSLSGIAYQDQGMDLSAKRLVLDIDDQCLLQPAVCLRQVEIAGLSFAMPTLPPSSEESQPAPDEPSTPFSMPIPISLDRLVLDDISLDILGNKVAWKHFSSAATLSGNQLILKPTVWDSITLALAKSDAESTPSSSTAGDPQAIELPDVILPLGISVERFTVTDFSLEGENAQKVALLDLIAKAEGSDVTVDRIQLNVPQGKLDVSAKIQLAGDYPLQLKAGLDVAMEPLSGHHLDVKASGSVKTLVLDARLSGTLDALLKGTLSPLDPELPFDLSLKSQHLQWPLTNKPEFTLNASALTASGDLKGYRFKLDSTVDGVPMPKVKARLVGKGSLDDVSLSKLALETLGGTVTGQASASWKDLVNWQGQLAFSHIQPGLEWPDVPGDLSGKLKTSGGLTRKGGWYVQLPELAVDGIVMSQPLDLVGQLDAKDLSGKGKLALSTTGLSLKHGPNGLTAKGQLDGDWDMAASINAPDLSQSVPGLKGEVAGTVSVKGKMAEPELDLVLDGKQLGWQDLASLASLEISGKVSPMPVLNADLTVRAAKGQYETFNLKTLALQFSGTEASHQLVLDMQAEPVSTVLKLAGVFDPKQGWQGVLQQGEIETPIGPWRLNRPTAIGYQLNSQLATVAAHCWQQDRASLCLQENLSAGASGRAKVALKGFGFDLIKPYLPSDVALKGAVGANVEAVWAPDSAPYLNAQVSMPPGSLTQQLDPEADPVRLGWDKVTLNALMQNDVLNADWLVAVRDNGDFSGRATVTQLTGDKQIEGNVKLDRFMLGFLQPLLADYHDFAGQVDANLSVSGPILHPAVNGLLKVTDVKAQGKTVPLDVDKADITATFAGYQARLQGKVVTPDGDLSLSGEGDWQDLKAWRTKLRVNGRELEVNVPPMVAVKVSPDLTITAQPKQAEITGKVEIPWGRITVDQLPESAVSVSKDEVILGPDLKPVDTQSTMPFKIKTNVLVRIGDDVKLSAFGLKSGLVGDLNVRQNDKGPLVYGEINLRDGTYRSFAQELVIRKGQILFNGPADQPYLSIEAIRDPDNIEDDVIAGIRVTGPADEPKVDIFSDPVMPQQNALSYILRGRDLDSESDSGDAMTMALISMGLAQSGQLVGDVGEAFGIQDLALDTAGSGQDSQVTISGYIAPGLQVKYGVGIFNSIGEFTVRYRLMKDLYVEVVSGLDSAVDLLYQFEFN
ncbi:hypothetical protein ABT56_21465 [Photobacterium aquae]|uniref:Translocation and assembly module TamB C-terminal domain-containing protein n=1 Tax=Photobacterium aquae TaxID=1195763 RepID=A0A0J1JK43_9GAMM|nr:translocation/assembly module TamB domain-containing protein [Photobacterium aquae]KLV02462.1 hypothetical protein ABT56_21465 [Photobacterium aquae]